MKIRDKIKHSKKKHVVTELNTVCFAKSVYFSLRNTVFSPILPLSLPKHLCKSCEELKILEFCIDSLFNSTDHWSMCTNSAFSLQPLSCFKQHYTKLEWTVHSRASTRAIHKRFRKIAKKTASLFMSVCMCPFVHIE